MNPINNERQQHNSELGMFTSFWNKLTSIFTKSPTNQHAQKHLRMPSQTDFSFTHHSGIKKLPSRIGTPTFKREQFSLNLLNDQRLLSPNKKPKKFMQHLERVGLNKKRKELDKIDKMNDIKRGVQHEFSFVELGGDFGSKEWNIREDNYTQNNLCNRLAEPQFQQKNRTMNMANRTDRTNKNPSTLKMNMLKLSSFHEKNSLNFGKRCGNSKTAGNNMKKYSQGRLLASHGQLFPSRKRCHSSIDSRFSGQKKPSSNLSTGIHVSRELENLEDEPSKAVESHKNPIQQGTRKPIRVFSSDLPEAENLPQELT